MKTSFWSIAALSFVLSAPFSNQYSQEEKAKGIIIYRASQYDRDEVALTKEYLDIRINSVVINVTGMDGRRFNVPRDRYVTNIAYQDFAFATLRYPQQIDPFMEKGKQMIEASKKYPSAKEVLAPHLEEMKGVANKLNQGIYLVRGQWEDATPPKGSHSVDSIPVIQTISGKEYNGVKVVNRSESKVNIMHSSGVVLLDWSDLDTATQLALGYDAAAIEKEKEQQKLALEKKLAENSRIYEDMIQSMGLGEVEVLDSVPSEFQTDLIAQATFPVSKFSFERPLNAENLEQLIPAELLFRIRSRQVEFSDGQTHEIQFVATSKENDRLFLAFGTEVLLAKMGNILIGFDLFEIAEYLKSGGNSSGSQNLKFIYVLEAGPS